MKKFSLVLSVAALLLALAAAYSMLAGTGPFKREAGPTSRTTGEADIGGPFTLVDQHGAPVTERDLLGRYALIYFGFTHCPDICPTTLQVMTNALDSMGEKADRILPVFVTVDPERDTVDAMAEYAANFHPRLLALTGTPEQVAATLRAYRIYAAKVTTAGTPAPNATEDYTVDHSSILYLMGPDGKFRGFFSHGASAEDIAAGLERLAP